MIAISKKEKDAVLAKYPNTHIVRTMIGDSKRHHYFCVEDKRVLHYLNKFRNKNVIEVHC